MYICLNRGQVRSHRGSGEVGAPAGLFSIRHVVYNKLDSKLVNELEKEGRHDWSCRNRAKVTFMGDTWYL